MIIDLRTDTVTKPTDGMRRAMATAEVGDEQKLEDPTVTALEQTVADLLDLDAAVFVPSATMANQIALRLATHPGDVLLTHATSHLVWSEAGGPAALAGLMIDPIATDDGRFDGEIVRSRTSPGGTSRPPTRLVAVENTHSNGGGTAWSLGALCDVTSTAHELGLATHLDGARLLNAALAAQATPATICTGFDTVTFCLSKGLGCPFGALLAGSHDRLAHARRWKQMLGGALRQAGIVAAAGLYALENHVDRLADDHANARRLATELADTGIVVSPDNVDTNVVLLDASKIGITDAELIERIARHGVLVSQNARPGIVRAVTHIDITSDDIETAIYRIRAALTRTS